MKTPRIIAEANGSTGTSYVPSARSQKVIVIPEGRTLGYYVNLSYVFVIS